MACQACEPLIRTIEILGPDDLRRVIVTALDAVEAGILRYIPARGSRPEDGPFSTLQGWPDIIDWRFACTGCGRSFLLACETYHGSGGDWRAV